jgi:hypothetical protein
MPKFGQEVGHSEHPCSIDNRKYAKVQYTRVGHTVEYKSRKRREYERRKEHRKLMKLLNELNW